MAKRFDKAREYTEKYKSMLLPCKYCGSEDIIITSERMVMNDSHNYWCVGCTTHACDCTGFYTSVKEAIKNWNKKQGGSTNAENSVL